MYNVAVIGAGVSGLGCALRIKEKFPTYQVTVITKDVTPNTTGDGSAGLWGPFLLGNTPEDKVVQWSKETHDLFLSLWREGIAGSCLIPCLRVNKVATPVPKWQSVVYGFRDLVGGELNYWKSLTSVDLCSAQYFVTFTCEPKLLLKYLTERLGKLNVPIEKREVTNLAEVTEKYDAVINCTGLGAKYMVPDGEMYSIRGQVARVKAPWMYHVILDDSDDGNYIIPNTETCVLGGTHQVNDYNTMVDSADTNFIVDGCESMIPGMKHQPVIYEWVGLRPGRNSVRLDIETLKSDDGQNEKIIIHNYGHGGSGVTLFWGCAKEVTDILTIALEKKKPCKL